MESVVAEKLKPLKPIHLDVVDITGQCGGGSKLNLHVVSEEFQGKTKLASHRLIQDLLKEELESSIHALVIKAETPEKWEKSKASE